MRKLINILNQLKGIKTKEQLEQLIKETISYINSVEGVIDALVNFTENYSMAMGSITGPESAERIVSFMESYINGLFAIIPLVSAKVDFEKNINDDVYSLKVEFSMDSEDAQAVQFIDQLMNTISDYTKRSSVDSKDIN